MKNTIRYIAVIAFLLNMLLILRRNMIHDLEFSGILFIGSLIIIGVIFIISFLLRKKLVFKGFFLSKFNLLNEKFHYENRFDIPSDLLLQKFTELMDEVGFKIIDGKEQQLLAVAPMSFWSWGENIYINITKKEDQSEVAIDSVTIIGVVSWGKNKRNFKKIITAYESSLII